MSFRQTIAKPPAVKAAIGVGLCLLAAAWSVYVLRNPAPSDFTRAYYTDDDGKTTFVDRVDRIVPFDHNGKTAVRALLFTTDDHRTSFVGYLERYTPEMARKLQQSQSAVDAGRPPTLNLNTADVVIHGTEFKKPGDRAWTPGTDLNAKQKLIRSLTPPGHVLDSVMP